MDERGVEPPSLRERNTRNISLGIYTMPVHTMQHRIPALLKRYGHNGSSSPVDVANMAFAARNATGREESQG
jgi:hypothetical protein